MTFPRRDSSSAAKPRRADASNDAPFSGAAPAIATAMSSRSCARPVDGDGSVADRRRVDDVAHLIHAKLRIGEADAGGGENDRRIHERLRR